MTNKPKKLNLLVHPSTRNQVSPCNEQYKSFCFNRDAYVKYMVHRAIARYTKLGLIARNVVKL